jgi:hypothetical protein
VAPDSNNEVKKKSATKEKKERKKKRVENDIVSLVFISLFFDVSTFGRLDVSTFGPLDVMTLQPFSNLQFNPHPAGCRGGTTCCSITQGGTR